MIYDGSLPFKSGTTLNVKLGNFQNGINTKIEENILPLNYSVNTFNFDFNSGALKDGMGFRKLTIPVFNGTEKIMSPPAAAGNIKRFWHFRYFNRAENKHSSKMVIYCADKKFYWGRVPLSDPNFYEIPGIQFQKEPNALSHRLGSDDNIIFCSSASADSLSTWNGTSMPVAHANVPRITSAALHAARMFATVAGDKSVLWFSDDTDITNWNVSAFDGGYIELTDERGLCNRVIEFNNNLYVIREYGISKVSAWGMQEDFSVRHLYFSNGRIFANSAVLCGEVIIMLCRDGLYAFDGLQMHKIGLGMEKMFDGVNNENAVGAFLDGKYYLACRLKYPDERVVGSESVAEYINNTLLEYDINTGEINLLRGVDISSLCAFQTETFSKLVACFNSEYGDKIGELTRDGKVFDVPTTKVWTSPMTDLDYPGNDKALISLHFLSESDVTVRINTDGTEHVFRVKGSSSPIRVPLGLRAKKFSIDIQSDAAGCNVGAPQLKLGII